MSIIDFIESLTSDRRVNLQIAAYKYLQPVKHRHMKLDIRGGLGDILKNRGIDFFTVTRLKPSISSDRERTSL